MTKLNQLLSSSLLLAAMLTSPISAAQEEYAATGEIYALQNSVLNLSDLQFRLSPTVKVILKKGEPGQLSDLSIGDHVGIHLIQLDNRALVDSIHLLGKSIANEDDPPLNN